MVATIGRGALASSRRRKDIPGMANLGFPYADVTPNGDAVLSKVAGTGGRITLATATAESKGYL